MEQVGTVASGLEPPAVGAVVVLVAAAFFPPVPDFFATVVVVVVVVAVEVVAVALVFDFGPAFLPRGGGLSAMTDRFSEDLLRRLVT